MIMHKINQYIRKDMCGVISLFLPWLRLHWRFFRKPAKEWCLTLMLPVSMRCVYSPWFYLPQYVVCTYLSEGKNSINQEYQWGVFTAPGVTYLSEVCLQPLVLPISVRCVYSPWCYLSQLGVFTAPAVTYLGEVCVRNTWWCRRFVTNLVTCD